MQLLALNIVLATLESERIHAAHWIDTTGSFSADHVLNVLRRRGAVVDETVRVLYLCYDRLELCPIRCIGDSLSFEPFVSLRLRCGVRCTRSSQGWARHSK